ncbi:hypothetical protein ID875_20915 [Streptomyces globisporus]|uniref:Uncharacterized protein n=1 Tax=Streptomyces globisporus TaxID=1908 RepID=A0A927GNX8_STRGL|nr:hypothetical protein [Streptomyces globisporus]
MHHPVAVPHRPAVPPAGQCSTRSETTQGKPCGATTQWERNGPRHWHVGPDCYTHKDVLAALAEELHQQHMANPHYPPSNFYPEKPRRRRRQRPPYKHTPMGPGDIQPGTWLWVIPGGLHPGWGDIHHLAMLTALGAPYCEVWMDDTTVHRVRPEKLIVSDAGRQAAHAAGLTTLRQASGPRPAPCSPNGAGSTGPWPNTSPTRHVTPDPRNSPCRASCSPSPESSVRNEPSSRTGAMSGPAGTSGRTELP